MARPSILTQEILTKASAYVSFWHLQKDEVIPTVEGLCLYIDVSKSTVYDWCKDEGEMHKEFSDIVSKLRETKAKVLQNKGVTGDFNAKIAGLLLGREGYAEKVENDITTGGEKLGVVILPAKEVDSSSQ